MKEPSQEVLTKNLYTIVDILCKQWIEQKKSIEDLEIRVDFLHAGIVEIKSMLDAVLQDQNLDYEGDEGI